MFFLKNHVQNLLEKDLRPFSIKSNVWINNLKFYAACLYCISKLSAIAIYWN